MSLWKRSLNAYSWSSALEGENYCVQRRWLHVSRVVFVLDGLDGLARRLQAGAKAQIHQCLCLTPNTSFRAYPRPQRRPLTKVPQQVFRRFRSLPILSPVKALQTDGLLRA